MLRELNTPKISQYLDNIFSDIIACLVIKKKEIITNFLFLKDINIKNEKLNKIKYIINSLENDSFDLHKLEADKIISQLYLPFYSARVEKININELARKTKKLFDKFFLYKELVKLSDIIYKDIEECTETNIDLSLVSEYLIKLTKDDFLSMEEIAELSMSDNAKRIKFFSSSFDNLNKNFSSKVYRTGDLHIIAARPAVGKTMTLLQEAKHFACNEVKTAFITLEMPAEQCFRRLLSSFSYTQFKELYNEDVYKQKIMDTKELLYKLPLKFYESYSMSYTELINKIKLIAAQGYEAIFIDQLSHIKHDEKAYSKHAAVEKTVRLLRSLALELNIAIIVAVQINRQGASEEEPELEHLKESGSIEEASQLVIMLHNPKKKKKDQLNDNNKLKVFVRKATHGKTTNFEVFVDYAHCKLIDS